MPNKTIKLLFDAVLDSSKILISDKSKDKVINEVLAILGHAANVDRCYIFENKYVNDTLTSFSHQWEWQKSGVTPQIDNESLQNISWDDFAELRAILEKEQCFYTNVCDIKDHDAFKEGLEAQQIKSVAFTPVIFDGFFWGFIGFDDCVNEREWTNFEIKTLYSISANLGAYLKRMELSNQFNAHNIELEKQRIFYETIFDNIPTDVVVLDPSQKYIYVNKYAIKDDALRNWIIGKDEYDYCKYRNKPIEIAQEREARFNKMLQNHQAYYFEEVFDLPDGLVKTHFRFLHPVFNESDQLEMVIGYGFDITELKQQEEKIRILTHAFENASDGMALVNKSGKFTYINKAFEVIYEMPFDEIKQINCFSLYASFESNIIFKTEFLKLKINDTWQGEINGITKSGKVLYQDISIQRLHKDNYLFIVRDITKLKQYITLLENTNQKLNLAIEATQLAIWEWDIVSDKLQYNEIFKQLFYDSLGDNYTGKSWIDAVLPQDQYKINKTFTDYLNDVNAHHKSYVMEYRININGNIRWILSISKVSEYNDQGIAKSVVGICIDTTNNKMIEKKLIESEERYRHRVDNLREIIFELDNEFRISFVNPAWYRILGYSIEQTISKQLYHFLDKDFKNECHIKLIQFMKDETSQYHFECVFEGQDKQQYWLDVELNKIVLNNKLIGYWGSMENITLRKNSEKKLIASVEKEKQLIELKARFVSMASHEFRTPLSSIRSSTELIKIYGQKYEMLATQFHQYGLDKKLDHILSDVDRITMLISDILTIGKIESGNVPFNPVKMDFVSFIKHYIHNEGYRFTSTHQLNFKVPSTKVEVNLDVKLIIHTLNNIFSNAAKYSENNTNIDIEILKKKNMVQLSIQDKGIGIPPEDLPYMFDSFFRSKNAELIPGTGLGLPIAKYFIELHGGSIQIKSKLDKGTKVIVQLPCV